jgi:hypothetical protein
MTLCPRRTRIFETTFLARTIADLFMAQLEVAIYDLKKTTGEGMKSSEGAGRDKQ